MDLQQLTARLAPRSCWQAMDMGTRLYRHWWRSAALVWVVFTGLPFLALAGLAAAWQSIWPMLLFWWLKPLWERPLLAFYSRAMFDDYPGPWALLKGFRGYGLNGLFGQLTWRRLSPARGMLTGVWQLEGNRGDAASGRIAVLLRAPGQRPATLTFTLLTLEHLMTVALILLAITLAPWQFNLEFSVWFGEQSRLHWALGNLFWYLVLTVTEPLYVATSFALYLNQRTHLEGWDLQLGLTRIGKRRAALGLSRGAGALALMVLCLGGLPAPGNAEQQDSKQQAVELLASDTFMPMELREERRLKEQFRDDDGDSWWRDLLQRLIDGQRDNERGDPLALPEGLIHAIGWTLLVALLAVIAWALLRRLPGSPLRRSPTAMPVQVAGLDTRAENLPADLAGALDDALRQGRVREALALLLRDTLVTFFRRHPTPLTPGATEQDCLRAYRQLLGDTPAVVYLERLTEAWTRTAWAHRPTTPEQVQALYDQWRGLRPAEART
jgi:bacterioferritin (cytochrome b1)